MILLNRFKLIGFIVITITAVLVSATAVNAEHSWGDYHWARINNPFTLKLGDNVSAAWDAYLASASSDWNQTSVLNTTIVTGGTNPRNCRPTLGRVEVCNSKYGSNGWLGAASIWINGNHITQGTVKVNDSYFNTKTYNTPAWRRLVMCQEIAHTLGLDHQDENFSNLNLGTCMDYTSDPAGPPTNEHPNDHDYEQLALIYDHADGSTTVGQENPGPGRRNFDSDAVARGHLLRRDGRGQPSLYLRDLGSGEKVLTFILWAE